jgi:hypothetical protein
MRNAALFGTLGVSLLVAAAGCEPVDDGAATRAKGWDPVQDGLSDVVLPGARDVFVDTDETMTVADGCAKTTLDAHKILQTQCASCHGDEATKQGLPAWGFILDDARMKTETWTRQNQPPIPFLKAGDADNSAIFLRAAINRDMPPIYDLGVDTAPRVTFSQASVLREWITHCM